MNVVRNRRQLTVLAIASFIILAVVLYTRHAPPSPGPLGLTKPPLHVSSSHQNATRHLVMGRLSSDDVSWLSQLPEEITRTVYVVDDPSSSPSIPQNKGHEAIVYLTYLIDNYDSLSDVTLFFHPHEFTWHNNILLNLATPLTISRLSPQRVLRQGYMNSRCHLDPGCPDWLHLDRPPSEFDLVKKPEEKYFTKDVWRELHPDAGFPDALSQPCCAQFAVSRDAVLRHPVSEYVRWRQWLLDTELPDQTSGRVMEYNWQYIFTGQPEFCPPQHECYCDGYGVCFGGEAELQNWLKILKQREALDDEIGATGKKFDQLKELGEKREGLDRDLKRLKEEAYKRGEDPRNRAFEAGRTWHDGDGF